MSEKRESVRTELNNGDVILSNILDSYTGESLTYIKITDAGSIVPDGIIYRKLETAENGTEIFKRIFDDNISVRWFGAKGDGITDDTVAVQRMYNTVPANSYCFFPNGVFLITDTITISKLRVHTKGSGKFVTQILFNPNKDSICFNFTADQNILYQGSLSDITFYTNDSIYNKTAIKLMDISGFHISNITISGSVSTGKASIWGGLNSIGINICGRDQTVLSDIRIAATRPILISKNSNNNISIDHFHFTDCGFIGNMNPIIEIEDGVNLTNVTFDGFQTWALGSHGIYWNDTTSVGNSSGLNIKNVRTEQGEDGTAYMFYIVRKSSLKDVRFENIYGDINRNGFYFRNIINIILDTVEFTRTDRIAIDAVCPTDGNLKITNCNFQTGSTANLVNYIETIRNPQYAINKPIARDTYFAYYDSSISYTPTINLISNIKALLINVTKLILSSIGTSNVSDVLVFRNSTGELVSHELRPFDVRDQGIPDTRSIIDLPTLGTKISRYDLKQVSILGLPSYVTDTFATVQFINSYFDPTSGSGTKSIQIVYTDNFGIFYRTAKNNAITWDITGWIRLLDDKNTNTKVINISNTTDIVNKAFLNTTYPIIDYPINTLVIYYNLNKTYRRVSATVWIESTTIITS